MRSMLYTYIYMNRYNDDAGVNKIKGNNLYYKFITNILI